MIPEIGNKGSGRWVREIGKVGSGRLGRWDQGFMDGAAGVHGFRA
jgi:hypothetical protein